MEKMEERKRETKTCHNKGQFKSSKEKRIDYESWKYEEEPV